MRGSLIFDNLSRNTITLRVKNAKFAKKSVPHETRASEAVMAEGDGWLRLACKVCGLRGLPVCGYCWRPMAMTIVSQVESSQAHR